MRSLAPDGDRGEFRIATSEAWRAVQQRLVALHQALLDRDPVAPADFAECALPLLHSDMRSRHSGIDADLITEACDEAVLDLCQHPERWDPERGANLRTYLSMAATGDIRNALKAAGRRGKVEIPRGPADVLKVLDSVELSKSGRNITAEAVMSEDEVGAVLVRYAHLVPEQDEREVLKLMIMGERDEAVFSVAMRISDLPELEKRRRVKQMKDRIKKRFQRALDES